MSTPVRSCPAVSVIVVADARSAVPGKYTGAFETSGPGAVTAAFRAGT
jgi:hypothetical protein